MIEIIAVIVLLSSLTGMLVILFWKIPVLVELLETSAGFNLKESLLRLKEKIKNWRYFQKFSFETFLQQILSKIRILSLKTDNKTSNWLQKLRARSQKKKFEEDKNYWEEIKKSKKK